VDLRFQTVSLEVESLPTELNADFRTNLPLASPRRALIGDTPPGLSMLDELTCRRGVRDPRVTGAGSGVTLQTGGPSRPASTLHCLFEAVYGRPRTPPVSIRDCDDCTS
jgi:hypothetical protein